MKQFIYSSPSPECQSIKQRVGKVYMDLVFQLKLAVHREGEIA